MNVKIFAGMRGLRVLACRPAGARILRLIIEQGGEDRRDGAGRRRGRPRRRAIFAERLQQKLGQPFVIENRGGAGGNVAAEASSSRRPTATR